MPRLNFFPTMACRFDRAAFILVFFFFIVSILGICRQAGAADPLQTIQRLIGPRDAVVLAGPDGRIKIGIHLDQPVVPASTLKVLTALAALHYLGEEYRFATDFYVDGASNLIIRGYGDPLLISEEIETIADVLKSRVSTIQDIVMDDGFFEKPVQIPGTARNSLEPYDAPNGALCVNFNTVNFKRRKTAIVSAEPQTPLVPLALEKIRNLPGKTPAGRILLAQDQDEISRYAGEIFSALLTAKGVTVRGKIRCGTADPRDARRIYRHHSSFVLTDILSRLLEFSNNFIANQLLLTMGAVVHGAPGTVEKGVAAVRAYAREGFAHQSLVYGEGAGISRENRVTARLFLEILTAFRPYHFLMPEKNGEYFKTGTLTGVSTRVGYLKAANGEMYSYGVFVNTPGKTAEPVIAEIRKLLGPIPGP